MAKVNLVRDDDRRTEDGERRSKGYGFIAFTEHDMALKTLEMLNDNREIFGGDRRPIVEFSLEDKRKLRMQQDLFKKHAHKLQPGAGSGEGEAASGGGKGKGRGKGTDSKGKGKGKGGGEAGKGEGKGKGNDAAAKKKKKEFSRGQRQREKRRAAKAAEADKSAAAAPKRDKQNDRKAQSEARQVEEKLALKALHGRRPKTRDIPDAPAPKPGKKAKKGHLPDDFELRALNKFRGQ